MENRENKSNKESVADYSKQMKDIKLRVPYTPGKFDENGKPVSDHYNKIKSAAESHNMTINAYILHLISQDIGEELSVGVKSVKKAANKGEL